MQSSPVCLEGGWGGVGRFIFSLGKILSGSLVYVILRDTTRKGLPFLPDVGASPPHILHGS